MRYTKLTLATQDLVAYDTIKRSFDSFAKRADRKLKPIANEVYDRLKKRQNYNKQSPVTADYRFEDKEKARTLSEGIKEFSLRFPNYGEKLQKIIKQTRKTKKRHLYFGTVKGKELPNEIYINALKSVGIPNVNVEKTFETVMEISDLLNNKKEEGLAHMLIK